MNIAIIAGRDQNLSHLYKMMREEISRLWRTGMKVEYFTSVEEYMEWNRSEGSVICLVESHSGLEVELKLMKRYPVVNRKVFWMKAPFTEEQVHSAMKQAQKRYGETEGIQLEFPEEKEIILEDVYYIHYKNRRGIVYQKDQEPYPSAVSRKDMTYALDIYHNFFWVNHSTVVNLNMIESIHDDAKTLQLKNGHYVKVTAGSRQELKKQYKSLHST